VAAEYFLPSDTIIMNSDKSNNQSKEDISMFKDQDNTTSIESKDLEGKYMAFLYYIITN
jgi:hypothetical protein